MSGVFASLLAAVVQKYQTTSEQQDAVTLDSSGFPRCREQYMNEDNDSQSSEACSRLQSTSSRTESCLVGDRSRQVSEPAERAGMDRKRYTTLAETLKIASSAQDAGNAENTESDFLDARHSYSGHDQAFTLFQSQWCCFARLNRLACQDLAFVEGGFLADHYLDIARRAVRAST